MSNLEEITKSIKKQNDKLDGLSDELVDELVKYQKEYEILLLNQDFNLDENGNLKRTQKNFNKAVRLDPSKQLEFDDIAVGWTSQYPAISKAHLRYNAKELGLVGDIGFKDITLVKVYQTTDLDEFITRGRELDAVIKRELVNSIALEQNYRQSVNNIATAWLGKGEKLGQIANWADSTMRTSVFGLTRSIDKQIYDDIGETRFIYVGALDKRTRKFCRRRVGKEFTEKEIQKFGVKNGSGLPGFSSPGGYRCRHTMVGVSLFEDE